VDDASRDETKEAALAVRDPRVEIVGHTKNRGVGAAIVTGYVAAQRYTDHPSAAFVVMAGDDQMDPKDLPALVRPIAEGRADYVKGCRFSWPDARGEMPLLRWLGGWGFSLLTSLAIGARVRDSQCGYTALSNAASRRLDLPGLFPGYGYPNDLLGQVVAEGLRFVEVPVRPVYRDEVSRLKLRHLPTIGCLVGRSWVRRVTRHTRANFARRASHTTGGA
jgi:glycosyltransferase involved in cell wall biosynthesis